MKRRKAALVYAHGAACGCLLVVWMTTPGILATGILSNWHFREYTSTTVFATVIGMAITIAWGFATRGWVFKQLERSLTWLLARVKR